MGNKLKVLFLNKFYPISIGHFFLHALQRREDIDLKTTGQFSGAYIPWRGGIRLPEKYVYTPDIPLSLPMEVTEIDYGMVKPHLGDWKPDLVINTSSNCYWKNKPTDGYSVALAIDPHCLDYDHARSVSDTFFNMQKIYSKSGDIYLPYAYDPTVHYEDMNQSKIYDVCMVGLEYTHRIQLMDELRNRGLRCHISNGAVYDEYRKIYSQSHVGINWSSLQDLNARAFETSMMSIQVMNRVPDMNQFEAFSRVLSFPCDNDSQDKSRFVHEAAEQVMWVMNNLDKSRESNELIRKDLAKETYDARLEFLIRTCGF